MASFCLNRCCICIPLRVGCFIVGYMFTICKTIALFLLTVNITVSKVTQPRGPKEPSEDLFMLVEYGIAFMVGLELIMSINLLIGLHKNKLKNLKNFYNVYPVFLTFLILLYVVVLASLGKHFVAFEWYMQIPVALSYLFEIYCVFVVKRCFIELTAKANENRAVVYRSRNSDVKIKEQV